MRKTTNIAVSGLLALGLFAAGTASAAAQTMTVQVAPQLMNSGTLTVGSTGTAVAELQGILSELGYLMVPRGVALGYFGPLTKAALMNYQASRGVAISGVFDSSTRVALQNYLAAHDWTSSSNTVASNSSNSNSSSNSVASTNSSVKAPRGLTGYWFNGNWYNSLPWVGTTTVSSNITEYWYNGTRYTISQVADPMKPTEQSTVAINNTSTGKGYWFNGVWTAIDPDDIRGGYYSPNPGFAVGGANYQQGGNGYTQTFSYTPAIPQ